MNGIIRVNGKERALDVATLAELLPQMSVDPAGRGIAIALNGEVVPRSAWAATALAAGDTVEIVTAFRGG